ncbi:hypothetical protein BH11PLA2_BH11PLA2_33760 [soil metagenome]
MKAKRLLIGILKYTLGFGLLAFVIYRSWDDKIKPDGEPIRGIGYLLQQRPDWGYVAAAAVLLSIVVSLQFYRWYLLVNAVDLPFTKRNALRLGLVGYFYNIFLPGAIGGDLVKAIYIAGDNPTRKPVAVATVMIDRLLGLFGLVMLASLVGGYCWASGDARIANNPYLTKIITITSIATAVIITGWLLLGFMSDAGKNHFESKLHKLKPRKLGQTLAELWFAIRTYRERSHVIYWSVLISAGAHICMVLLFHVCVRVFPLDLPATLEEHAVICPIGYIGQVFFPVPGGVGGAEFIFGELYAKALNRPEQTGVVGRLTLRVFEWAVGLIGYLMFLNMKKELKTEEPAASESIPPKAIPY